MKRSLPLIFLFILLSAATVTLPASASPTITSISPATGPNDVPVTVVITGTGYNSGSIVTLTKCGTGGGTITGTISSVTATKIIATFDITGQAPGKWTVRVNTPYAEYPVDLGVLYAGFEVYKATSSTPDITTTTTTTTTTTPATTVTTTTTSPDGENSVFFETSPSGATIYLDGTEIGTSTFTYNTKRKGTFDVLVKKIGYEDYEATVLILEGKKVHFFAPLSLLSDTPSATVTTTAPATTKTTIITTAVPVTSLAPATPSFTTTTGTPATTPKPSRTLPTPWPTDTPVTKKSPYGPAPVLFAVVLAIVVVVMRRQ